MKEGADILPFAAAPDSNGLAQGEDGVYQLDSWNSFVSAAFGVNVKPLFTGDLKTLYPWKFTNNGADQNTCAT